MIVRRALAGGYRIDPIAVVTCQLHQGQFDTSGSTD